MFPEIIFIDFERFPEACCVQTIMLTLKIHHFVTHWVTSPWPQADMRQFILLKIYLAR